MVKIRYCAMFLLMALLCFGGVAVAAEPTTYGDLTVTVKQNTVISDITVNGTLTLENVAGGTITLQNCQITNLVLKRAEDVDAPVIILGESCQVDQMTLLDSAYVQATEQSVLTKLTVADMCDVQFDGNANELDVTAEAVVTMSGQVETLAVSQSAQVNLVGMARVNNAVFENPPETADTNAAEAIAAVLKIDTYATVNTLNAGSNLVVNGTGSINTITAQENSAIALDVTITREDSAKTDIQAIGNATINYTDEELLPMMFDAVSSLKLRDAKTITLQVKDVLGYPLDPVYSVQSSNDSVVSAQVSGDQLTLTHVGNGSAIISVTAKLTGYLSTRTAFMVNSSKEAPVRIDNSVNAGEVQLALNLSNICNKTIVSGETVNVFGISCNEKGSNISVVSSNPAVANVSPINGGSFTITGKAEGIAAITVSATKEATDNIKYLPAVQKFVVLVDNSTPARIQLTADAPTPAQLTKIYDGTTAANISVRKLSGVANGDVVYATAIAFYADADAGNGKTMYISYHIYGQNANEYLAPKDLVVNNAIISRKDISIVTDAVDRNYEPGNTSVQLTGGNLTGLIPNDRVTLNDQNVMAVMNDEWAGVNKPVAVTGFRLTGSDAGNYSLAMPGNVTVTIMRTQQAKLEMTGAAAHVYGTNYQLSAAGGTGTGDTTFSVYPGGTGIATVDNETGLLSITKAGTILLTATKAGDGNYVEQHSPVFTLTVGKAGQSPLSINSANTATFGDRYTATTAGGSGAGSVTFSVISGGTGVAAIDSQTGTLSVTKAGTILLSATKAEDDNYFRQVSPTFTLTVGKAPQTAQTSPAIFSPGSITYGENYTAALSGGRGTGSVTYSIVPGGTGVATIDPDTGELTVTKAGTILLMVTKSEDDNYFEQISEVLTLTVNKTQQDALDVTSVNEITYGDDYALTAAGGTGNGAITYSIVPGGTGEATIDPVTGELSVTKAGTLLLKATKAEDDNYLEQNSATFTLSIQKAQQDTLTVTSAGAMTYGDSYTVTTDGGTGTGNITYSIVPGGSGEAIVDPDTGDLTVTKAGTIFLKATKAEDDNYLEQNSTTFTLTVNKAAQSTLSIASANSMIYSASYTAAATGGTGTGSITYSIVTGGTGMATINSSTGELSVTQAGTIFLKATKAEDDNYLEKSSATFTLNVAKAEQSTLTVVSANSTTYGNSYTVTTGGGNGTGSVTYSIVAGGTGAATINSSTGELSITRAGTILLSASKAGDNNYLPQASATFTLTVNKAAQSPLTIASLSATTYGSSYTAATAGGSGTGAVTYSIAAGGTGAAAINGSTGALSVTKAGTILIVASKAGDENYLPQDSEPFTLTVDKAAQAALTVTSASSVTMGGSYTVTASGGSGSGDITYNIVPGGTGSATINGTTGVLSDFQAGTVQLVATRAGDDNYLSKTSTAFTLTINKAAQAAITVTSANNTTYGSSYTLTASGGTGSGALTFSIVGGTGAATIDSNTGSLSITRAGTILLKATRAEDWYYLEENSPTFTLTVSKAAQPDTLSVTSGSTILISDSYTVTAAGGTGTGAVTFSVVAGGTGTATINSTTGVLSVTKAGTIQLRATKAADENYLVQDSATFTLTVNKGDQTLLLTPAASSGVAGTTVALTPSAPGSGAVTYSITGGTSTGSSVNSSGVVTLGTVGTVTVTATKAECSSYYTASASVTINSTPVAPIINSFTASRASSFDSSYRDLATFSPSISNPSGNASYPVTVTYSIVKTGTHGSYVHSSSTDNTARLAVGTYQITCTATNDAGSASRTTTIDIPSSTTSTGAAQSGITGHYVTLYFNGDGSLVTSYNYVCHTASGHSGSDNWYIYGYTGVNQTGTRTTLASGSASAGITDTRSVTEASSIKSIEFTYHVDDTHGSTCLSSDVTYSVTMSIPYNDVQP